jgi:hypothetical protein
LRNSKRRKISFSCERSGGCEDELGRVAVDVEVAPHRRELLRDARLLGVLGMFLRARRRELVACSITSSSEPYCAISWPRSCRRCPGRRDVVEVSPFSPMKSATCSGVTP